MIQLDKSNKSVYLNPRLSKLRNIIGQKILDIGFYIWYNINYESAEKIIEFEKRFYKDNKLNISQKISQCWDNCVLILENQTVCIWNPRNGDRKLYIELELSEKDLIIPEYTGFHFEESKESEIIPNKDYTYIFLSALKNPDFSDQNVNEMIGKKILDIKIVEMKYEMKEFCGIKLILENDIEKIIGTHMRVAQDGIEILPLNRVDHSRIGKFWPIE